MGTKLSKQYSVFLENRVGALAELCKLISDRAINIYAICAIDTIEEAVLRIVPENETETRDVLQDAGFRLIETDVILVELDNIPGATGKIATQLSDAGINIDYVYASTHSDCSKAFLVLRVHQTKEALKILMGGKE
ncbi:MAG: amino acid-binding protein [Desulfobacteraceae bacterium]|nr:amino acid-binding protein [Desulfobacteraceae bacterium]MBC2749962.1 amino acid-binding protein [Desulfobacteraceae bacterium]